MTLEEIVIKLNNLEKNLLALVSRDATEKIDETNTRLSMVSTQVDDSLAKLGITGDELIDTLGTVADFMEDYYLSQF